MRTAAPLLALALAAPAWGAFDAASVGTTSGVFLKMPAGARAAAMGEAQAAAVDDATALAWNPAALTRVKGRAAAFMHAEYLAETGFDYGAYAQRVGPSMVLGLGLRHFSAGRIAELDATGTETGSFSPRDLEFAFGLARALPRGFSVGGTIKHVSSKILATAEAQTVDVGALYAPEGLPKFSLGFAATNLFGTLRYERFEENLPTTLRAGAAWRDGDWTGATDLVFPRDNAPHAAFGVERRAPLMGTWRGALRAGFNTRSMGDVAGFAGPSFGLGIARGALGVDYAFVPLGGLGASHLLSVAFSF